MNTHESRRLIFHRALHDRRTSTLVAAILVAGAAASGACSDDSTGAGGSGGDDTSTSTSTGSVTTSGNTTASGTTTAGSSTSSSSGTGGAGGECMTTAQGTTRGDAIAVSPDDATIVVANRDVGTITVLDVDYTDGMPAFTKKAELVVGAEPWQVAIDACGETAYVVTRKDQKLVTIHDLKTTPVVGASVSVGSEPTAVALSPNGSRVYVANWVDGTVVSFDPATLAPEETLDLNVTLAASGLLGASVGATTSRPALAHPRSIAITNDGDADDMDEKILVTEFFAQRTAPEAAAGANADTNWVGIVYQADIGSTTAKFLALPSLADTGFADTNAGTTGCFANQLQSITVDGGRAYVTSICASPRGPAGAGNVKNTHPVVHVIDLATGVPTSGGVVNLAKAVEVFYAANPTSVVRYPLVANDIAFGADGAAYVSANGTDSVFRVTFDATTGAVDTVGAGTNAYADLAPPGLGAPEDGGKNPIGIVSAHSHAFGFVSNDVSRNVSAVSLDAASFGLAGGDTTPRVASSTALPTDPKEQGRLRGKWAFNTGLDRWSQGGQGAGACQSCHFEGLSDNVTWYFARGPRQSSSLDGSFASNDSTDQRIFNWTAVNDEMADFESVARNIDGAVGAIVSVDNHPPMPTDQINLASTTLAPPSGAAGLNGSAETLMNQSSALQGWDDIALYVQSIRSPRAPSNLDATKVAAGEALFSGDGGCQGCHGGAKWTLSKRFYAPSGAEGESLKTKAWDASALTAAGFPSALLPAITPANQVMRFAGAGGDQIQCVLRPVGTFGVSPPDVNVLELRTDMIATGQGGAPDGNGFNVPSILGMQVGAPYFHAGNARTLEEMLSDTFTTHRSSLAVANFLSTTADRDALVAYLLSVDESTAPLPLPAAPGAEGGDFCAP